MTNKEVQEKCSKGLCFTYDDNWGIGHHCNRKKHWGNDANEEDRDGGSP